MKMLKGKFLAFEGGEGSGKDTMIDRLKVRYTANENVIFTREPGGTVVGERIRSLLLSPEAKGMSVESEILLFLAARRQLMSEVILPALDEGKTVISNRFRLSTVAYQIFGRNRKDYLPLLKELEHQLLLNERVPYYILLDVSPHVGLRRVESRNDGKTRFDAETLGFHLSVREGYLQSLAHDDGTIIDASQPLENVWQEVKAKIEELIGPPAQ